MTNQTNQKLEQLISDIYYAKKCLYQVGTLCREVLTEKEKKSNEGVNFGSALFGLKKDIEKACNSLELIRIFRNPEENKEFIDILNSYAKQDGAENYTGSINPPTEEED
tara:strand:- start:22 stop:348 length:327 start_codon:yes stop_codon:yes gene_type:complete